MDSGASSGVHPDLGLQPAPLPVEAVQVVDEFNTIEKLAQGCSIARYGDGEFQLVFLGTTGYLRERLRGRRPQVFENGGAWFTHRLRSILAADQEGFLVGIPNVFRPGAELRWKGPWWYVNQERMKQHLVPGRTYYSAFFARYNRRDEHHETHWERLRSIWDDKRVLVVHFNPRAAHHVLLSNASRVRHVECERRNAWGHGRRYRHLLHVCREEDFDVCLASLGPVANLLAYDLFRAGRQCIDAGQIFSLYDRLQGPPVSDYY